MQSSLTPRRAPTDLYMCRRCSRAHSLLRIDCDQRRLSDTARCLLNPRASMLNMSRSTSHVFEPGIRDTSWQQHLEGLEVHLPGDTR
jgi:hypothetical protein